VVRALLGLAVAASLAGAPASAEPWQLERSDVQTVQVDHGAAYRLLVAWPEGEPPAKGWPVLWVLDGEDNFAIAAMTARRLAAAGARSGIEPGLVVGVDSGSLVQRVLDYTPAVEGYSIPQGMPAHGLALGGADAFLDLLEGPLRSRVTDRWPVDPQRQTLLGHSFGGLLSLHALNSGRSFSGYVAASPSLWYGDGKAAEWFTSARPGAHLLLVAGTAERNLGASVKTQALAERLQALGGAVHHLTLEGLGHGSTMLAAIGPAIEAAFGRDAQ